MVETENRGCYTVCVFQDTVWAGRGLEALRQKGFEDGVISVLSKQSAESMELFQELFFQLYFLFNLKEVWAI